MSSSAVKTTAFRRQSNYAKWVLTLAPLCLSRLDETPPQTLAALATVQNGKNPVLLLSPSEQTIAKPSALTAALQQAIAQVEQGSIVILGVPPTLINL